MSILRVYDIKVIEFFIVNYLALVDIGDALASSYVFAICTCAEYFTI